MLFPETVQLAKKVLIFLVKQEIPATPENYKVWFAYHSGRHEDLEKNVKEKISRAIPIDSELTAQLHERYFGDQDKQGIISLVENQAAIIIKEVIDNLLISRDDTSEYNRKLHQYSLALSAAIDVEDIRGIINTLISDTKQFEEANVELQYKLEHITVETENLKKQIVEYEGDLLRDPLTSLYNRRALDKKLEDLYADFKNKGSVFSVIMADINSFKQFNDQYGHIIGDNALQIVSASLEENTKGNDFVGRYGGDEFILLLPETNLDNAAIVAKKLGEAVSRKKLQIKRTGKIVASIHISLGISQMQEEDTLESVVERADEALALAKTDKAMVRVEKDLFA